MKSVNPFLHHGFAHKNDFGLLAKFNKLDYILTILPVSCLSCSLNLQWFKLRIKIAMSTRDVNKIPKSTPPSLPQNLFCNTPKTGKQWNFLQPEGEIMMSMTDKTK